MQWRSQLKKLKKRQKKKKLNTLLAFSIVFIKKGAFSSYLSLQSLWKIFIGLQDRFNFV